ncbi:MAG: hypothetical protein JXR03_20830, partial [Cyclobacteriaceae bacterium]
TVVTGNDSKLEPNENITVNLGSTSIGTITDSEGTGTINDDDTSSVTINNATGIEGGNVSFTLELTQDVQGGVVIDVILADDSAIGGGTDYTSTTQRFTFTGTAGTQIVNVPASNDNSIEGNETFDVSLLLISGNSNVDVSDTGVGTIDDADDNAGTQVRIVKMQDGSESGTDVIYTVSLFDGTNTLTNNSGSSIDVDIAFAAGSTAVQADLTTTYASLTPVSIANGTSETSVTLEVFDDVLLEGTENLRATISTSGSETISIPTADADITDNDVASVTISDGSVTEGGNISFNLELTANSAGDVTVDVSFADDSATGSGIDYTSTTQQFTFSGGVAGIQTVTVPTIADNSIEGDETFTASLTLITGNPSIDVSDEGTGTILDADDGSSTIINIVKTQEGDEEGTDVIYTVSLSDGVNSLTNNTGSPISVNIGFAVGSDAIQSDFVTTFPGTVTIPDMDTDATVTLVVNDDSFLENTETLRATIVALGSESIGTATADATIADNDNATISVNNVSNNEGNDLLFTITLDNSVQGSFDVTVDFVDAGATGGGTDYTSTTQTVTFAGIAGESQQFTVSTNNDVIREAEETFTVQIDADNVLITDTDQGTGTINDNDASSLSVDDVIVNENAGTATFTITLNGAVQGGTNVDYLLTGVSAAETDDYSYTPATLSYSGVDGQSQTFDVSIVNDLISENSETFVVSLSASNTLVVDSGTGTGTIFDNDNSSLSIDDVTVTEGGGNAVFTVTLNGAVQGGTMVTYSFSDGAAIGGTVGTFDYNNTNGILNFVGTNTETQQISLVIENDDLIESSENFSVNLSSSNPLVTATDIGAGIINDNDNATLTVEDIIVNESAGVGQFVVTLNGTVPGGTNVTYSLSGVTATDNTDFDPTGGILIFSGSNLETETISFPITNDDFLEGSETLTVSITSSNTLVDATDGATATITDNDAAALTIGDVAVTEGGTFTFEIALDNNVQGSFDVDVTFTDGTATGSGTDYDSTPQVVSFSGNAGETQTFTVTTNDEAILESTESFTVNLSSQNPLVNDSDNAIGTINDDDATSITAENASASEGDNIDFILTLNNAVAGSFNVDVSFSGGTATAGIANDYDDNTQTIAFTGTAGEQITVSVPTTEDGVLENDETFNLSLLSSNALVNDDDTATGIITNDDAASVTIEDISVTEGNTLNFVATLSNDVQGAFDVAVSLIDISAIGGDAPLSGSEDYVNDGVTLNFTGNSGETRNFSIDTQNDAILESSETFRVQIDANHVLVTDTDVAIGTITDNDNAEITIENAQANEGESILFTVTLNNDVQDAFDVNISYSDVSTNDTNDYDAAGQLLSFYGTAGEQQQFTVSTIEDNVREAGETFTVNMVSTNALVVDTDNAVGTILDDEIAAVSVEDITVNENAGTVTITVSLDVAVQGGVDVGYTLADNTAGAGSDYTTTSGTLNFAGNQNETQTFTISITDDNLREDSETIDINLSTVNALVDASDNAIITILDNDVAAVTIENISAIEGSGLIFTATLDSDVESAFTVTVNFSDVSATGGDTDYDSDPVVLNFAGNAAEMQQFTVNTTDDVDLEGTESFALSMTASSSLIDDSDVATGTINDNDITAVTIEDVSVTEGATATYEVTLSKATVDPFTVTVNFSDASATRGVDYENKSVTLNFAGTANEIQSFTLTSNDDAVLEGTESYNLSLSSSSALVDDADTAIGTILDNDAAQLTIEDVTDTEGNTLGFDISLDNAVANAFTVTVTFTDGTATGSTDYSNSVQTVNFDGNAGESKSLNVTTVNDNVLEGNETFTVKLESSNILVGDSDEAVGTISDNDVSTLTIEDVTVTEGGDMLFEVTLDNPVTDPFDVVVGITNVTTSSADYTFVSTTLNFGGSASESKTFTIPTVNDDILEGDQTFTLNITSSNALVGDADTAIGTIQDNDAATLTITDETDVEANDLTFTVTLNAEVEGGFTVDVNTIDVLTVASDFDHTTQMIAFTGSIGETQDVTINVTNDTDVEDDETFNVTLDASNASIVDSDTGLGTILNDDFKSDLSIVK